MLPFALLIGLLAPPANSGEVRVVVDPPDAIVRIDGALIAPGRPVWIEAGAHTIEVTRAGHRPHKRQFLLDAGGRARFDVKLVPAASPPPAAAKASPTTRAAPRPPLRPQRSSWVNPGQSSGVITGRPMGSRPGVTDLRPLGTAFFITALVTGLATGIVAIVGQVKAKRFRDERSYVEKLDHREDARDLGTASKILLGVTGAFAGAGFIMFAVNDAKGPSRLRLRGGIGYRGTF